jgi:hypothetical protein
VIRRRNNRQLRLKVYRGPEPPSLAPGDLLLEYFSDTEIIAWKARAEDLQQYHYLWFYELEGQRAARQLELQGALQSVSGISIPLSGWGRAIAFKYSCQKSATFRSSKV